MDPKKVDFSVYARATVVTPNLMEAERGVGRSLAGDEAVAIAADAMRLALDLDALLITRGPEGMTLSTEGRIVHIPAQIRDVADVTGAGDTVVAVLAACLGSGWDLAESCRLANVAAGIAVSHPGTYVIHADELSMGWKGLSHKILNPESARRGWPRPAAAAARSSSPTAASTSSTPATWPRSKGPSGWATSWSSASTPTPRSAGSRGTPGP